MFLQITEYWEGHKTFSINNMGIGYSFDKLYFRNKNFSYCFSDLYSGNFFIRPSVKNERKISFFNRKISFFNRKII